MRFSRTNPNQTPGKHYSRAQKSVSNHSQQTNQIKRHQRPNRPYTQLRIMYIMLNRISKLMVNEPDGALQGALRYPSRNI